jgi:hypothetical protein
MFSHLNFFTLVQPLKLIWCSMFSSSQVQLSNQSYARNIITTIVTRMRRRDECVLMRTLAELNGIRKPKIYITQVC